MTPKTRRSFFSLFLIWICLFSCLSPAFAVASPPPSLFDPEVVSSQINTFIQKNQSTTAGVSIAVIQGAETLHRVDYGYADIANHAAVDSETVFEWGSVTKLLVWTSVMQLAEQGRLDLNAPVSTYLPPDFLQKLTFSEPITMMHLMHHNAGWDDAPIGVFVKPESKIDSLEDALRNAEPRQSRKPGEAVGYSNFGTALAGYIVERISGEPFYAYVNQHIFTPLGTAHTSLHPTQADHPWVHEHRRLSKGYSSSLAPVAHLFAIPLYPAGMATGTMDDFILFCKALLPAPGAATPLFASRETLDRMLSPTLKYGGSSIAWNSHGFWSLPFSQPMLGHGGNTAGFSAYLLIHPQSLTGFVVMTNQVQEAVYNSELPTLLFGAMAATAEGSAPLMDARTLRGAYQSSRTVHSGLAKLVSLMMTIPLPYATEYSLSLSLFGQNILSFQQTSPHTFTADASNAIPLIDNFYATTTPSGRPTLQVPYMEFVQIPTGEAALNYALFALLVLGALECAISLLISLITRIVRRVRKRRIPYSTAYKSHLFLCAAGLGVFINILWFFANLMSLAPRTILALHLAVNIAYIATAVVCLVLWFARLRKAASPRPDRVRYYCTAIATLVFIANLLYWNLCWF